MGGSILVPAEEPGSNGHTGHLKGLTPLQWALVPVRNAIFHIDLKPISLAAPLYKRLLCLRQKSIREVGFKNGLYLHTDKNGLSHTW